jgi:hypothetical protein
MRLRPNERCPIHKSLFCCGRETLPHKPRQIRLGVQRIEDPHHPRGYRELRSLVEMRKLLNRKIAEQNGICPICESKFTDYADVVPDHKRCKGMEERGEMTTQTIFKLRIGGAMKKKDHVVMTTDGPSVG